MNFQKIIFFLFKLTEINFKDRALAVVASGRPALLDVLVTPEAVSSDAKSGLAWVPDLQALAAWDDAERKWRENKPEIKPEIKPENGRKA